MEKIAIYGIGYVEETLLKELKGTSIKAVYGIDRKAGEICTDIDVVTVDERLNPVDAVMVTAVTSFDKVAQDLHTKMDYPVISLEDIRLRHDSCGGEQDENFYYNSM